MKVLLKISISSLLLYFSLRNIPLSEVLSEFPKWNFKWLIARLLLAMSTVFLQGMRWKFLLGNQIKASSNTLIRYAWMGKFFELLVPFSIGGELFKAHMLGKEFTNKGGAIATALQAKVMGIFSLFLLGVTLGERPKEDLFLHSMYLFFFFLLCLSLIPWWWPKSLTKPIFKNRFENIQLWLSGEYFTWRAWGIAFAYSILIQFMAGVVNYTYLVGVGASISLQENFLYFPWMSVVILLPISLFGVGGKEAYNINTFANLPGVTESQVIQFSLAGYILILLHALMGALVYLLHKKKMQEETKN